MTTHTQRFVLWSITAALTAAGVSAVVVAAVMPLAAPDGASGHEQARHLAASARAGSHALSFGEFSQFDLRRPLSDTAAPSLAQADEVSASSTPPVRLVGTISEVGQSLAIFEDTSGHCLLKSVGQDIAGAMVLAIVNKQAIVAWRGERVVLSLPAKDFISSPSASSSKPVNIERNATSSSVAVNRSERAAQTSGEARNVDVGVPTDEREMRALLNRKLTLDGD